MKRARSMVFVALLSLTLGAAAPAQERAATATDATAGFIPAGNCRVDSVPAADGRSPVTVRGASCDGRPFIRIVLADLKGNGGAALDSDLDVKVATLTGFNDIALHDVELKVWRHDAMVRDFTLTAQIGPGAQLIGRQRVGLDDRRLMVLETNDAGTLFRFLDLYPRIQQGRMRLSLDVSARERAARESRLRIQDFRIVGEPALRPLLDVARAANVDNQFVVSRLNLSFKPLPDKFAINEGAVHGQLLYATVGGIIDLASSSLNLTGALVPVYASESPTLLGPHGYPEGLIAMTYQITGSPQAPILRINPFAPPIGSLRKLFEFQADDDDR
jgi:hypothetical protein